MGLVQSGQVWLQSLLSMGMMCQFMAPLDCWRPASRKASWNLNPVVSLEVGGGDFPGGLQTSEVAQSCPILYDPMDCSLPGSSIHGIFQARVLE